MSFAERLAAAIKAKSNPTVMGLDPLLTYIPQDFAASVLQRNALPAEFLALVREDSAVHLQGLSDHHAEQGEAVCALLTEFNKSLIDAVKDLIPAVKPQIAYYERYGLAGLKALEKTMRYAREQGMLVILDAKRNDIGTTAAAYAEAFLGESAEATLALADALTVNAYLGIDGIRPFLDACVKGNKGIFALVRTSNPSAGDLQDLRLQDGRCVYEAMADLLTTWSQDYLDKDGYSPIGAVVGATWPEQAAALRERLPHSYILVPGYGAQGGGAADCMPSFKADGKGAIVNASRSLMCAYKKREDLPQEQFSLATRDEAVKMRDALNDALEARS